MCVRACVRACVKVKGFRRRRQRASGGERLDLARFKRRRHHLVTLFVVQLPRVSVSVSACVCVRAGARKRVCAYICHEQLLAQSNHRNTRAMPEVEVPRAQCTQPCDTLRLQPPDERAHRSAKNTEGNIKHLEEVGAIPPAVDVREVLGACATAARNHLASPAALNPKP